MVENPPANAGVLRDVGLILGLGRSLKKEMATCFSTLAWKIPCRLLDSSHSDWHEMVPYCGFGLHFSDNE